MNRSGLNLMNEDALARLEAGLRAQREKLGKGNAPLRVSSSLTPADGSFDVPVDLPDFLGGKAGNKTQG
jgi:hypothetical protein